MFTDSAPSKEILDKASAAFSGSERISKAVEYFNKNPKEFDERALEFDMIVMKMNSLMKSGIEDDVFRDVTNLAKMLPDGKLPTLLDLSQQVKEDTDSGKEMLELIRATFEEVKGWNWVKDLESDYQLASGILIEGYGELLAKKTKNPKVKRNFVLGFEEVGIVEHPEVGIIKDVLPWLIEEKTEFPERVQWYIDRAAAPQLQ